MPKRKKEELGSLSKSEKMSLNRLYSRGRAAYGSVRNLGKASGLSKKKQNNFYKSRHSIQSLDLQSDFPLLPAFLAFSKYIKKIGVRT